jgi:hypothetical protein
VTGPGRREDGRSSIIGLGDICRVEWGYRVIGFYDDAIGADDAKEIGPIELTEAITNAHDRSRKR